MKRLRSCKGSTTLGSQPLGAPSHQSLSNPIRLKNIDDLPEFLLEKILYRLPCKFVLRCKCVCKSWSTLVSDPYFDSRRALYIRNNNCDDNEQVPMFVNYYTSFGSYRKAELLTVSKQSPPGLKVKQLDFGPSFFFHVDEVVATYNDLVLMCLNCYRQGNIYYICNPTIKQWIALPPAPIFHGKKPVGFTLDSDNRCCKVVRILGFKLELETPSLEVQIFSSETGEWIQLDLVLQGCKSRHRYSFINIMNYSPVAHNGTLYWITCSGHLIGLELFSKFNINTTKCHGRLISNPNPVRRVNLKDERLCVCQGSVRLCQLYSGPESKLSLYIWELKEDDEWCSKEFFDLHPLLSGFQMRYRLLAFDSNDEDILYLWRKEQPSETLDILMCNIRTLTATEISQKFSSSSTFPLRSFQFVLPWWRWPTPVPRLN